MCVLDVYNCLTIHGLASASQLPASVLEVSQFWKTTAYIIGGHTYSLDDIEHGILRGEGRGTGGWLVGRWDGV